VPTRWDYMTFFGTLGFFFLAFALFIPVLPMISIFEMRDLLPSAHVKGAALKDARLREKQPALGSQRQCNRESSSVHKFRASNHSWITPDVPRHARGSSLIARDIVISSEMLP